RRHDTCCAGDCGGDPAAAARAVPPPKGPARGRGTLQLSSRQVAIVTDSTADLPPVLAATRAISVVPLTLHFDGQSLLDGVDITPEEFYRRLPTATTHPTTSQPSPGRF